MTRVAAATLAVLAFAAFGAQAQERACAPAEETAAQEAIDRVVTWEQLVAAWREHRHCDRGSTAELFTDALLRLVVDWKNVEVFAAAVRQDPEFKAFVHRHLRSPEAAADREAVLSRAKASCPPLLDAFCAELAEVVKAGS